MLPREKIVGDPELCDAEPWFYLYSKKATKWPSLACFCFFHAPPFGCPLRIGEYIHPFRMR